MSIPQPAAAVTHPATAARPAREPGLALYLLPALVCLLVMLPRLLDAHFGLMDDGFNLARAREITSGSLGLNYDGDTGRFRPLYWLFVAGQYALFGLDARGFFAVSTLTLALTTLALVAGLRRAGAGAWLALAAGLLFPLSVPVIESYYTLGKGEPLQVLCLALSLLVIAGPRPAGLRRAVGPVLLSAFCIFLSTLNKETSLVILPIAAGWVVVDLLLARLKRPASARFVPLHYLLAAVLGLGAFYLLRSLYIQTGLQGGSYTSGYAFTAAALAASAVRWTGWLVRSFSFLVPLLLLYAAWAALRRELPLARPVLYSLVWMAGWLAVFLPWQFAQEYYLLPFALGAVVLTAALLLSAARVLRTGPAWRAAGLAGLLLSGALFLAALAVGANNARVQIATDRANWQMLQTARGLPEGSRLLINIRLPNEYSDAIALYLARIFDRPDLTVTTVPAGGLPAAPAFAEPTYLLAPHIENQPLLTVRLGVVEPSLREWNTNLAAETGGLPAPEFNTRAGFRALSVDLPRLFCSLIPTRGFCVTPAPLLDRRAFSYGWDLYRLP